MSKASYYASKGASTIRHILIYALFTIVLLAGIMVIVLFYNSNGRADNWIETTGIISKLENETTWVDYLYKEIEIVTAQINEWSSTFKIGDSIKIKYNPDNKNEVISASTFGLVFPYVGGAIVVLVGLIGIIIHTLRILGISKTFNKVKEYSGNSTESILETNYVNEVNESQSENDCNNANNSDLNDTFYIYNERRGSKNVSMCDKDGNIVYTAKIASGNVFKGYVISFSNLKSGNEQNYKIGSTATISSHSHNPSLVQGHFKLDGKNCWDYLKDRNISIKREVNGYQENDCVYEGNRLIGIVKRDRNASPSDISSLGKFSMLTNPSRYEFKCSIEDIDSIFLVGYVLLCLTMN